MNSYEKFIREYESVCVCVRMREEAFSEKFMRCRFSFKKLQSITLISAKRKTSQSGEQRTNEGEENTKAGKKFLFYDICMYTTSSSSYLLYHNFILSLTHITSRTCVYKLDIFYNTIFISLRQIYARNRY
jgi:hypothetical protein